MNPFSLPIPDSHYTCKMRWIVGVGRTFGMNNVERLRPDDDNIYRLRNHRHTVIVAKFNPSTGRGFIYDRRKVNIRIKHDRRG